MNLLVVSLIWKKRGIPLYWELLDKLGSTSWEEQRDALSKVLPLLEDYCVVVLGDREFCSVKLGRWLNDQECYFCLRLKCNTNIRETEQAWCELRALGLTPGTSLFLNEVEVTKQKGFGSFNVASKWKKRYRGFAPHEPWFILTNLETLDEAIVAYQKRFGIEEMFRDLKLGGYSLESCKLSGERLVAMMLLIALAYVESLKHGQQAKRKGLQKYLARPESTARSQRRHSAFHVGLCVYRWSPLCQLCEPLVVELMKLNPNKRAHYKKGLRAMALTLSAF